MPKKRSEAGVIIAYFSLAPLIETEALYSLVTEVVRRRRAEGKCALKATTAAKVGTKKHKPLKDLTVMDGCADPACSYCRLGVGSGCVQKWIEEAKAAGDIG